VDHVEVGADLLEFGLRGRGLFAELAPLVLTRFTFGGILGLTDRFRDFVGLSIELVDLGLLVTAPSFERQKAIDVGFGAAQDAILFYEVGVLDDESSIKHDREKNR
jgi:hypothetical protein